MILRNGVVMLILLPMNILILRLFDSVKYISSKQLFLHTFQKPIVPCWTTQIGHNSDSILIKNNSILTFL
jgi:hypothetical protein